MGDRARDRGAGGALRLRPDPDARASRTPGCSSARPARPRTWCTRRCTRSPTAATARSRCGPRAPRRSRAPTSSTGSSREPQPVKLFTIAPMYRYGRPGRGRYREHWQLSLEAIGSAGPEIDAEVIQFYAALLGRLGVTEWELHLNSIGDAHCRPAYVERLNAWLDAHPELRDRGGRPQARDQPAAGVRREGRAAARRAGRRAQDRRVAVRRLPGALRRGARRCSTRTACRTSLDPVLVRGLDYYTRTAFEFVGPEENVNSTICGGGRYDGLVEAVGGPPTPGIGFGAGLERLMLAIEREAPEQPERARARRLLRARRRPARSGARADGRPARARARVRHRLRGPLAQGSADAGRADGRADGRDRARDARPCCVAPAPRTCWFGTKTSQLRSPAS